MIIYYAHPAFNEHQLEHKYKFLGVLTEDIRECILDPFAISPTIEGDRDIKKSIGRSILQINHNLIVSSDIILANIDDRDQGVIYEIGYASALNKPIITYSSQDYDVNVMLSGAVIAHIQNIFNIGSINNLIGILDGYKKSMYYVSNKYNCMSKKGGLPL